jgi:hypothetical protein
MHQQDDLSKEFAATACTTRLQACNQSQLKVNNMLKALHSVCFFGARTEIEASTPVPYVAQVVPEKKFWEPILLHAPMPQLSS